MKCASCNANLTDFESTRFNIKTGLYLDLCNECFYPISKEFKNLRERYDLYDGEDENSDESEGNL